VQPNTSARDDGVIKLREHVASNVGIIQTFLEWGI
jgi:hypothetical protein